VACIGTGAVGSIHGTSGAKVSFCPGYNSNTSFLQKNGVKTATIRSIFATKIHQNAARVPPQILQGELT